VQLHHVFQHAGGGHVGVVGHARATHHQEERCGGGHHGHGLLEGHRRHGDERRAALLGGLLQGQTHALLEAGGRDRGLRARPQLVPDQAVELQQLLAVGAHVHVTLELDLRRGVELAIDERSHVPLDQLALHTCPTSFPCP
jgi:hypothetical protein